MQHQAAPTNYADMALQPEAAKQQHVEFALITCVDFDPRPVRALTVHDAGDVLALFGRDIEAVERIKRDAGDVGVDQRHHAPAVAPLARAPTGEKRQTDI